MSESTDEKTIFTRERQIHLPAPRFELVWEQTGDDWKSRRCTYALVIPMKPFDLRANIDDEVSTEETERVIVLGVTNCTGGNGLAPINVYDGSVETPFRDGTHARWDAEAFGGTVPIIAVCGASFSRVDP